MSWLQIDDQFNRHPKIVGLSLSAVGLHALALSYCCDNLTDGDVPAGWTRKQGPEAETAVVELINEGLWHEADRGWRIHDFLDYNPSRAEVEAKREEARERMRKARKKRRSPEVRANNTRSSPNPTPTPIPTTGDTSYHPVRELFDYWREQCKHSKKVLSAERRQKIEARLREGATPQEIRKAIDGAARAAYVGEAGVKFDDIELICRNRAKLDLFIERADQPADERQARRAEGSEALTELAGGRI